MTGGVGTPGDPAGAGAVGRPNTPVPAAESAEKGAEAAKSGQTGDLTVGHDSRGAVGQQPLDLASDFEFDGAPPVIDEEPTLDEVAIAFTADTSATGDKLLNTLQTRLDGLRNKLQQYEQQRLQQMRSSEAKKAHAKKHKKLHKILGWLGVAAGALVSLGTMGTASSVGAGLIVASLALTGTQAALQETGALDKWSKDHKKGAMALMISMMVAQVSLSLLSWKFSGAKNAADAVKDVKALTSNSKFAENLVKIGDATGEGVITTGTAAATATAEGAATAATTAGSKAEVFLDGVEDALNLIDDYADDIVAKSDDLADLAQEGAKGTVIKSSDAADDIAPEAGDLANIAEEGAEGTVKTGDTADDIKAEADDLANIAQDGPEGTVTRTGDTTDDIVEVSDEGAQATTGADKDPELEALDKYEKALYRAANRLTRGATVTKFGTQLTDFFNQNALTKLNKAIEDIKADIVDLENLQKTTQSHQKDADKTVMEVMKFIDSAFDILSDVLRDDAQAKTRAATIAPPSQTQTA